jgi:hypothetical protein
MALKWCIILERHLPDDSAMGNQIPVSMVNIYLLLLH